MTPDKWTQIEKQALENCTCDDPIVNTKHHCQICTKRYEYWNTTVLRLIALARSEVILREAMSLVAKQNTPEEYEGMEGEPPGDATCAEAYKLLVLGARKALTDSDKLRGGEG